ncbi:protein of unknown function [Xenorhabdus poinarii G6]|uniref:Uncharacterized protein n=1 Tax=Xenorhabdus poinarii G6 TaxID=1354304 RepID=A0A068R6C3_9GAMM|nr:protein of unknown function [Xenorhabdus poinarii G6]
MIFPAGRQMTTFDVLIKNKKTFTATGLTISAFKGGQMYRKQALPFRLREFSVNNGMIVKASARAFNP